MKKFHLGKFPDFNGKLKLLLVLNITLFLIICCFIRVSATIYSKNKTFIHDTKDKFIVDILSDLEDNSNSQLFYQDGQADVKTQQQKTITGLVTDSNGLPMPGVTILVKGTTQGTITNENGTYKIANVPKDATLVFSFVGMRSQEVAIGDQSYLNIQMEQETIGIDEVVAIGYGTVKKSDLTGSVSSIKAEELQTIPITSIDQGLIGRAAGVMVTQTSGMPGAIASIRIRGTSSLQGGNEPLYVIDGFPVYNGTGFGNTGGSTRYSGLSTINPSDIESIEILKDASATAIYGARAANGVVLITTKSGQRGTDMISFEASYGVQNIVQKIELMNALEFAELINEAHANDNLPLFYNEQEMQQIRQNPEGTDWQDEIFRAAPTQDYQLNFSGGDQKMTYSISANYNDQQGIIRNSDFKRYSGRVNFERNVLQNFKTGAHLTMSKTIANAARTDAGGYEGIVSSAIKFNPVLPVYSNKDLNQYILVNNTGIPYANPVATAEETIRENQAIRLLANIYAEWEIFQSLKAKVSFGTDIFNTKFNIFIPSNIYESAGVANATVNGGYTTNWLNENTLSWNKEIFTNHQVSLLGGITMQKNHFEGVTASSEDYVNDVLTFNSLQAGAVYNQPSSSNTDWSLLSYLGRINYNINDRYLLSLSARIDGSSRFGMNNKYAFFPSGALAWRLIDNLKFRVSYGVTGNQEIGLFNSLPTLASTNYTFNRQNVIGFLPNKIPNPDLKWEKTAQYDVGLDIGFLKNRFRITGDYYLKKTTDLIYDVGISFVSGFSTSLQNIGSVENKGLELSFDSDNLTGKFQWKTNFNISFNKNKVLELGGEQYKDVGGGDGHLKTGSPHRLIIGEPVGLFYGFIYDGIFRNQQELDAGPKSPTNWLGGRRYKDLSGPDGIPDGIVNATHDRAIIGDPNPKFFGGMANTFFYKGVELNVFLQYSYGNDIFNYNAIELELPTGGQNVYKELVNNRWSQSNPNGKYSVATTNRSAVFSSAYIEDGSYLKLKSLTLSYSFPGVNLKTISNLKLYVTGQNLLTYTNYKGYDPEVSYRGATNLELGEDYGGYPQAKTIMIGVNINIK